MWRSKWIILLTATISASVVAYNSFRVQPSYQAEAILVVGNLATGSQLGRLGGEDMLAATYSDLIQTPVVLRKAIEQSGLDKTPAELEALITSETAKESPYFRLQATDYTSEDAIEEANAVAKGLVAYLDELQVEGIKESREKIVAELADIEKEQSNIRTGLAKDDGRLHALDQVKLFLNEQYEESAVQSFSGSKLRIISLADVATANKSNAWRNTIIAFFAGALAGIGLGFAVDSVRKALLRED